MSYIKHTPYAECAYYYSVVVSTSCHIFLAGTIDAPSLASPLGNPPKRLYPPLMIRNVTLKNDLRDPTTTKINQNY